MTVDIKAVRKGDVVRFKSYALRVESEPVHKGASVLLAGRTNVDGCPTVTRWYLSPRPVEIERPGR